MLVVCWGFSILKLREDFGAHSDWLKFEMERSDWSRAVSPPGAPLEIPYYRSNGQILGSF